MEEHELKSAVRAGMSVAKGAGLAVEDASVLHNSNRVALRLTPCDALARVAPAGPPSETAAEFEVEIARRLAERGSPVAELDPRVPPRVQVREGFSVTLWTYYAPRAPSELEAAEYAEALGRLHSGFRQIDLGAPAFTDRVAEAQALVGEPRQTPGLRRSDRQLLSKTLSTLSAEIGPRVAQVQLLHGEPHRGNVLRTSRGLLFIDLETCCRGPVEFDVAHGLLPARGRELGLLELCEHYPEVDKDLVEQCHTLIWAMITAWRWDRDDRLPDRDYWRVEGLQQLRSALARSGPGSPR